MRLLYKILFSLVILLPSAAMAQTVDYDANLLKAGTKAPDFKLMSINGTDSISLSNMQRQPLYVLIDFWASWCPDCRRDIPQLRKLLKKYDGYGITCLGISFDTDSAAWKRCVEKNKMDWVHASELKKWKKITTIDRLYNVDWIPSMYLIDPDGNVLYATIDIKRMGQKIDSLVSGGSIQKNIMPEFSGSIMEFLRANLQYPPEAEMLQVEGRVVVDFVNDDDGNAVEPAISKRTTFMVPENKDEAVSSEQYMTNVRLAEEALEREALRVVRLMPQWKPATINGRKTRVWMSLPVSFRLK